MSSCWNRLLYLCSPLCLLFPTPPYYLSFFFFKRLCYWRGESDNCDKEEQKCRKQYFNVTEKFNRPFSLEIIHVHNILASAEQLNIFFHCHTMMKRKKLLSQSPLFMKSHKQKVRNKLKDILVFSNFVYASLHTTFNLFPCYMSLGSTTPKSWTLQIVSIHEYDCTHLFNLSNENLFLYFAPYVFGVMCGGRWKKLMDDCHDLYEVYNKFHRYLTRKK